MYLILLDKSDITLSEVTTVIEALGLITNMCIQMSVGLSCTYQIYLI